MSLWVMETVGLLAPTSMQPDFERMAIMSL